MLDRVDGTTNVVVSPVFYPTSFIYNVRRYVLCKTISLTTLKEPNVREGHHSPRGLKR